MIIRLLLFSLLVVQTAWSHPNREEVPFSGLESIRRENLASWTRGFFENAPPADEKAFKKNWKEEIRKAFKSAYESNGNPKRFADAFLANILAVKPNRNYTLFKHYKELADAVFAARKQMRFLVSDQNSKEKAKAALTLLGLLADELLYVMNYKGIETKNGKFWLWREVYHSIDGNTCQRNGKVRLTHYRGIKICSGDVFVTKGGAASSSLLARIMEYPGNFSHSTVAWVRPGTKGLYFPESFTQDGVKLRDPKGTYYNPKLENRPKKRKTVIFRYHKAPGSKGEVAKEQRKKVISEAIAGADWFVDRMDGKEDVAESYAPDGKFKVKVNDPIASFEYDFKMDTKTSDSYFCSEVPFAAYEARRVAGKIPAIATAYPRRVWSRVPDFTHLLYSGLLGITEREIPAPSDIELNPAFDIVALEFDASKLGDDRRDVALIDALMYFLKHPSNKWIQGYLAIAKLKGNHPVTDGEIEWLKSILPPKAAKKLSKDRIHPKMTIKHLIFFGFLDHYLAYEVKKHIRKIEEPRKAAGQSPLDIFELRANVFDKVAQEFDKLMKQLKKGS